MLRIQIWDVIDGDWATLNLPADCRDGKLISNTLDAANAGFDLADVADEDPEDVAEENGFWNVEKTTDTGNLLIVETRSDRGHQAIIIVNYLDQAYEDDEAD